MTLSSKGKLLSDQLWTRHEAHYFKVFLRALEFMGTKSFVPEDEIGLNRELYDCLLRAERELDPDGVYPPPMIECSNQPDLDDEARTSRENKRPDFTWGFTDPHEPDYRKSAKQFVVECKRLGSPARDNWILNANYVEHGIQRFIDAGWAYGKRFSSAAMIGYLQSMQPGEVLIEVNRVAERYGTAAIVLSEDGWQAASISRLGHSVTRSFPTSPLRLNHLWIDLRGKSFISRVSSKTKGTSTGSKKRSQIKK